MALIEKMMFTGVTRILAPIVILLALSYFLVRCEIAYWGHVRKSKKTLDSPNTDG